MAITVKHSKVSTIPDTTDTSLVRPSDWNADHTLVGTIDVPNGGTGASTLTGYVKGNGTSAMTASATIPSGDVTGLGTMSTQNANAVAITGGTINGTTIGATTPSSIVGTTITGQTGVLRGTGQNAFLQSSALTNAAWGLTNLTATGSQTDPFGGSTAVLLNTGAVNGAHLIGNSSGIVTASAVYTISIYAKAGTANFLALYSNTPAQGAFFNLTTGAFNANLNNAPNSYSSTDVGNGWWRFAIVVNQTAATAFFSFFPSENGTSSSYAGTSKTILIAAPQLELGSTANTYIPTTTTAVYGTPTLSFSGVSTLGLESNGALFLQPAGTGAIQAQATTSTTAGGNVRGANAVDWSTARAAASNVASGAYSILAGGYGNTAGGSYSAIGGGLSNSTSGLGSFVGGGNQNTTSGTYTAIAGGNLNSALGYFNFIGGGFTNSGTANAAVTTQSGTMNATTAVTLSGSNANIKVGQLITGTSIANYTYVAAISGTSLTLSQAASGSSTSTLSFFTPHGVVVGGGNNQATGSYSFIGGGGDAGTAANRNVASGAWSVVCGGNKNTASGLGSFVGGNGGDGAAFYGNISSGVSSAVVCGTNNTASGNFSFIGAGISHNNTGAYGFIGGGIQNTVNTIAAIMGGVNGNTRSIIGNHVFPACSNPIANASGISQAALLILAVQTTDATATALRSDASAAGTTNQVILPNNSAYYFRGEIISGVTGGGNTKGFFIEGVIKRGANAASTALVGTPTVTSNYADAGASTWAIAVTADTTNGGLRVTFTGQASTTIRTVAQIRTTEMTY